MGAIYGGKLPHTPGNIAGGFTAVSSAADKQAFATYLDDLIAFIETQHVPDAELLANLFPEYLALGKGYGHLLSFGVFELDNASTPSLLLRRGRLVDGNPAVQAVDPSRITEQFKYSWYTGVDDQNPAVEDTIPQYPKGDAYSWLKAPRYDGVPYETGSVARLAVNGDYTNGVSVMDRHIARARENLKVARAMRDMLAALPIGQSAFTSFTQPESAASRGLTEAPRGALGHWLQVGGGKIARYQVLTPTCWNLSPRDGAGVRGPLEQALIGVPVANSEKPIEVLRVVHSYDPCLDCATHVMRAEPGAKIYALGGTQARGPARHA
jgi:hydrogenase large subunit